MQCCDKCRFFRANPPAEHPNQVVVSGEGVRGGGECRVNPPAVQERDVFARFPVVANDDWCGRFEKSQ